jgi:hypothetical protein
MEESMYITTDIATIAYVTCNIDTLLYLYSSTSTTTSSGHGDTIVSSRYMY